MTQRVPKTNVWILNDVKRLQAEINLAHKRLDELARLVAALELRGCPRCRTP
jgi:hypothetical protein